MPGKTKKPFSSFDNLIKKNETDVSNYFKGRQIRQLKKDLISHDIKMKKLPQLKF